MNKSNKVSAAAVIGLLTACLCGSAMAVSMVADGEIESKATPAWSWLTKETKGVTLGVFEEDATWNLCLRLDVVKNGRTKKTGAETTNASLLLGGTAAKPGYPVVGGRKYKFSFEAKGTVDHAHSAFRCWNAAGKMTRGATTVGTFRATDQWMQYKGTFTVPDDATTAAIEFKLYADFERYPGGVYPFPEESYLLLDKFSIEPVTAGRAIWPSRAEVLPEGGAASFDDFWMFASGRTSANVPTKMTVRDAAEGLRFELEMSGAKPLLAKDVVWSGDSAELVICGTDPKADQLHWVVGPNGMTWAEDTNPASATCAMTGAVTGADAWKATFDLPWTSLGYAERPPKGTALRFNVGRNTLSIANKRERMTVFGFNGGDFKDKSRFAVLYVGAPEGLAVGGDASAFYLNAAEKAEKERLAKLARERIVVAQMPIDLDPSVPFLPDELMDPSEKLSFAAAIGERGELPVAIANMTEEFEELYVQVVRGYEKVEWQGHGKQMPGLRRADGKAIGRERLTLRRGVRFRDSDAKDHGVRYDILAKMNEPSALPVPSKEAGLFWLEVDTTGLEPGVYRGELIVTALAGGRCASKGTSNKEGVSYETVDGVEKSPVIRDDSKIVPIEFEVLPFELDRADFGYLAYEQPHGVAEIDFLNEMGGCAHLVTPWGFTFACDAQGHITKYEVIEHTRQDALRIKARARRFGDQPTVVIGYSWYEVFRKVHAKRNNLKPQSEAYWTAYREHTRHLVEEMKKMGFSFDEWTVEVIDEPNLRRFTREEVVNAYRIAREVEPKMSLLVTEGEHTFFEAIFPYVNVWVFKYFGYDTPKYQEYAKRMHAAGKTVSMYACATSPRQNAHRYYRQLSWKAAGWGSRYVSLYEFKDLPYEATFRRTTYGGIVYWTAGEIDPSVRQKSMAAGLNDVRYLRLLERLAAKSSDAALAAEAKDFIARSIEEVTRTKQHDPTATTRFRAKCVELIGKIQKR